MKNKVIIFGVKYAVSNYFDAHVKVLQSHYDVEKLCIDEHPLFRTFFSRRSFISFPVEALAMFCFLIVRKPKFLISVGPKCGLIAAICSRALFIRNLHWFTGQQWASSNSPRRSLAFYADRITAILSTLRACDSPSQKKFLESIFPNIKGGFISTKYGSINGLSAKYFEEAIHRNSHDSTVYYIGRITSDKGVFTILQVAKRLEKRFPSMKFHILGPLDDYFDEKEEFFREADRLTNVQVTVGFVDPLNILEKAFCFFLPSKREGFGTVLIEAQALGTPVLASNIYGVQSSLIDNETGYFCETYDIDAYVECLSKLFCEDSRWLSMSRKSVDFALKFHPIRFRNDLKQLYLDAGIL